MTVENLLITGYWVLLGILLIGIVKAVRTLHWVKRSLREYDSRPPAP